jgi:uncharacterized membrane protein
MRILCVIILLLHLPLASAGEARLRTTGQGASVTFDPRDIPAAYRPAFGVMQKKCTSCHTMERTVIAIRTGTAPVTGQPFDKQAIKAYAIKMLRKPDSGMSTQEIRDVVMLLNFLLDENRR